MKRDPRRKADRSNCQQRRATRTRRNDRRSCEIGRIKRYTETCYGPTSPTSPPYHLLRCITPLASASTRQSHLDFLTSLFPLGPVESAIERDSVYARNLTPRFDAAAAAAERISQSAGKPRDSRNFRKFRKKKSPTS